MPRLDAMRVAAWRELQSIAAELERVIDAELRAEWDLSLGWFDVLAALQRCGGAARPSELADELRLVRSSLSRRLDGLAEEGWVVRREGRRRRPACRRRRADPARSSAVEGDERHLPPGRAAALRHLAWRSRRRVALRGDPRQGGARRSPDELRMGAPPNRAGTVRGVRNAVIIDAVRTPLGKRNGLASRLASRRPRRRDAESPRRPQRHRPGRRRRRRDGLRHAGGGAGDQRRPQRRAGGRAGRRPFPARRSIASAAPASRRPTSPPRASSPGPTTSSSPAASR